MMISIQQVLDYLIAPIGLLENTVDRLETGKPDTEVTGIGVTFMPTYHVIQQAIELGINLLITHEGIYYSHQCSPELLQNDPVYLQKRRLIEESGIAIFRLHDYIHKYKPDMITSGLIQAMNWEGYIERVHPNSTIVDLPEMTVAEIANDMKLKLRIPYVRIVGDRLLSCKRAGILVGYRGGGTNVIPLFTAENLDVVIVGEGPEWEAPEYVRDAAQQGRQTALIVMGHAESEAPGMRALAKQLQAVYHPLPVHFMEERPLFQIG
ncbi:Nif3-like dinuclear metal center hexameric protein [Paenibacillus lentus]|uniref:GTP cyclohydrolase 1 type 2 homolog n=1 Tax=Paenibacillus lentus TaxID=1338368 RepID=A0A3S8RYQ8_9BACL|nr:Nif3-like dinuclear metal center hexameric protein [Paenibacillus lentus]AZK48049.1 transcriptional regulator [Paenibacillus lentus]